MEKRPKKSCSCIKIDFIIDLIWGLFLLAYVKPGDGELASSPSHVRFGKLSVQCRQSQFALVEKLIALFYWLISRFSIF
jgi:hypothetical protein